MVGDESCASILESTMSAACPVLGFDVCFRLAEWVDETAMDRLCDDFIEGPVEGRGLMAGGGGDREWRYTLSREGGQAVEADRAAMVEWAAGRREIATCTVGPLVDLSSDA